ACATGRIDACLDLTDPEPLTAGHPLCTLPNVWITPTWPARKAPRPAAWASSPRPRWSAS
ncbi:MAG TPA: dihydrofolate reductase, partial [Streptosporangiaceae bacterium]